MTKPHDTYPLLLDRPPLDVVRRLMLRLEVDEASGCWLWQGAKDKSSGNGSIRYGRMSMGKKRPYVHRVAYAAFVAPIPEGMTVEHLCRQHLCCNPQHLTLLTIAENTEKQNIDMAAVEQLEETPF